MQRLDARRFTGALLVLPFTHDIRRRRLNLQLSPWNRNYFLALHIHPPNDTDTNLTKTALLIYSIYRTYNYVTHHNDTIHDYDTIFDIATQFLYEGTFGHQKATKTLDHCFTRFHHNKNPNTHNHDNTDNLLNNMLLDLDTCDFD